MQEKTCGWVFPSRLVTANLMNPMENTGIWLNSYSSNEQIKPPVRGNGVEGSESVMVLENLDLNAAMEDLHLTVIREEQGLEAALKYQDPETTMKINPCHCQRLLKHLLTRNEQLSSSLLHLLPTPSYLSIFYSCNNIITFKLMER